MKSLSFVMLLCMSAACVDAHAAQRTSKDLAATSRAPAGASVEATDAIRGLRALEAKLNSGMSYSVYSQEVSELAATLSALEEFLEQKRGSDGLRRQLALVLKRYQDAKELWGVCALSDECPYGLLHVDDNGRAARQAKAVFSEFPAVNVPREQGGVLAKLEGSTSYTLVYYPQLLLVLWDDAKEQGKLLRAALH